MLRPITRNYQILLPIGPSTVLVWICFGFRWHVHVVGITAVGFSLRRSEWPVGDVSKAQIKEANVMVSRFEQATRSAA